MINKKKILGTSAVFLALILGAVFFTSTKNTTSVNATYIPEVIPSSIQKGILSSSAREWFDLIDMGVPSSHMKNMLVTVKVQGTVISAIQEEGRIDGLQFYHVGSEGGYDYKGKIELEAADRESKKATYYFSPKRMEVIKLYKSNGSQKQEISFSDLEAGDTIELEETVDLAKDNTDDANVVSLTVTVLE